MRRIGFKATCLSVLLVALGAHAQEGSGESAPSYDWKPGPGQVILGSDVAQVELAGPEIFLDANEAKRLLTDSGNKPGGKEVGIIATSDESQNWFLIFEYDALGYVKDDEKDKIDADALLESIQEGTEAANAYRKERGLPGLHIVGWSEPPHYDERTNNLVWGILAKNDNGREIVNYNVKVLGREGVMSVTLVDEPARIAASKESLSAILSRFEYRPGRKYSEWRQGDRVAEYGLTALVAAGAGAAAVKMGFFAKLGKLLAKGGKFIILLVIAAGSALLKGFKALFGRKDEQPGVEPPPGT
jgi:uncharacterized membrane-anchored protein